MSLLRAASLIAILSLVSKFVGLARDQVIAYFCGLRAVTDAYQAASLIPFQFALIMLGGLNGPFHSAIVTTLMSHYEKGDKKRYGRVLTTAIVSSVVVMGVISVLLYVFADQIVQIWGRLPASTLELAVLQLRILAPVFLISGLIGILYGILAMKHSFVTPSLSPILASLGVIVALMLFHSDDPHVLARSLAWGTLWGAVGQLVLQVLPLLGFFREMHWELELGDADFHQFLHLLLPAGLSSTIGQINVFIIQFFAGGLREGSIAAFRYGNLIVQLPLGILLTALLVPLLPLLSSAARDTVDPETGLETGHKALKDRLNQGVRPILLLTIPVTLLLACYGYFAIVFLFQHGQFNADDSWLTFEVLVYLSLSITVYAIRDLLIRVFYALGDSRTPFFTSFVTIASMLIFSLLLSKPMGVGGVSLASSIAAGLNFAVLAWLLHRRIGPWMQSDSWAHLGKVLIATLPMGILGWFSFHSLVHAPKLMMILRAGTDSVLLTILYVVLLLLLKDREMQSLLGRFSRKKARS